MAPAERVTLHLRAADGTYAGPVIAGVRRGRAVVGFRAGARLGRINVRSVMPESPGGFPAGLSTPPAWPGRGEAPQSARSLRPGALQATAWRPQ